MLDILGSCAKFERSIIRRRQTGDIALAKRPVRVRPDITYGRRTLTVEDRVLLTVDYLSENRTQEALATTYRVSQPAVSRVLLQTRVFGENGRSLTCIALQTIK